MVVTRAIHSQLGGKRLFYNSYQAHSPSWHMDIDAINVTSCSLAHLRRKLQTGSLCECLANTINSCFGGLDTRLCKVAGAGRRSMPVRPSGLFGLDGTGTNKHAWFGLSGAGKAPWPVPQDSPRRRRSDPTELFCTICRSLSQFVGLT